MKKRLLAQILALCMVLSLLPVQVLAVEGDISDLPAPLDTENEDGNTPAATYPPGVEIEEANSSRQIPAGDTITFLATSPNMEMIVTGMAVTAKYDVDGQPQEVPLTASGELKKIEDDTTKNSVKYALAFTTTEELRAAPQAVQFEAEVSYKLGNDGAVQTGTQLLPETGSYLIVAGAPAAISPTTPYDLTLYSDGRLSHKFDNNVFKAPGVYLTDAYGNSVGSAGIPSTGIPDGQVTVQPDTPASGWGITDNSVTTASFGKSVAVTFGSLQFYTDNGEALEGAKIKYTSAAYGEAEYVKTELYQSGGAFNIPGAKLTAPSDPVKAGEAVTLAVAEAKDSAFEPLSGAKRVTVTDVTGGASRSVYSGNVTFAEGAAEIELPAGAFTESTLGERTLDVTIGDIYQTLHTKATIETAKSVLTITGLTKAVNGESTPISGADITKAYDGTKTFTVPASWGAAFADENGTKIPLTTSDYQIKSIEFDEKDAGARTATVVVELRSTNNTKNYSLAQDGTLELSGASITKKELTVSRATAANKVYNGNDLAEVTPVFSGLASGERLTADDYGVTAAFDTKDVGARKPVTYAIQLKPESAVARNYTLPESAGLPSVTASITAAPLTAGVVLGIDNTGLEGVGSATVAEGTKLTASASLTGAVGGETPALTYTWTVDGKTAAADEGTPQTYTVKENDKSVTVTVTLAAVSGETNAVNGNYTMAAAGKTVPVGTTMIDAAGLVLPENAIITKPYDKSTAATLPSGTKVTFTEVGGAALPEDETVNYTVKSVTYNSPNVSEANSVTVVVELSGRNPKYTLNNGTFTFNAAGKAVITRIDPPAPARSLSVQVGGTKTLTIETDGAVTAAVDDEAKATAVVKGSEITVTGVAAGTAKLTVSAAAGGNYNALAETVITLNVTRSGGGSSGGSSGGSGGSSGGSSGGGSGGSTSSSTVNSGSTGGTVTVNSTASVSSGVAVVNVSESDAQNAVDQAVRQGSGTVTFKMNTSTGTAVNTARVELPASALSSLSARSSAALEVETPLATVTIPNSALYQLTRNTSNVTVATAAVGSNAVSVALEQDGWGVGTLSAGMKVELPLTNTAPTSGVVAVLVDSYGNETILPKSAVNSQGDLAVLLETGSATIKYQDNSKYFYDVSSSHWSADAVDFVSSHGLFRGTTDTTFDGHVTMNRAMLVTVLHRLESTPSAGSVSFADVPWGSYYADAAAWASSKGIVQGDGTGFNGSRAVTREEMAVMLYRYVQTINGNKGQMGSYSGMGGANQVSSWARDAMRWAVGSGIIQGDNGNLKPQAGATRAEVAQMLVNFVELITE